MTDPTLQVQRQIADHLRLTTAVRDILSRMSPAVVAEMTPTQQSQMVDLITEARTLCEQMLREVDIADRPTPPDTRPYRRASAPGETLTVTDTTRRIDLHQVGWHGQSGAFYALDEHPSQYEHGSWGPLYVISHTDRLADLAPDAEQQRIAYRIRAELVCCDIYGRVHDTHEFTLDEAKASPGWHDLCY